MSRLEALMGLHRQDPSDPDLYFMIASDLAREGRHAEAAGWLTQYVERGSDVGAGWALLADCHEMSGDDAARREALRRGIDAALRSGHPTLAAELRDRLEEE